MKKRTKRVIPAKSRASEREVQRGRVHSSLTGGRNADSGTSVPERSPSSPLHTGGPETSGTIKTQSTIKPF